MRQTGNEAAQKEQVKNNQQISRIMHYNMWKCFCQEKVMRTRDAEEPTQIHIPKTDNDDDLIQ